MAADPSAIAQLTDEEWADEIARGAHMTVDEAMEELLRMARAWGITPDASVTASGRLAPGPAQP